MSERGGVARRTFELMRKQPVILELRQERRWELRKDVSPLLRVSKEVRQ